jgi:hypothetical protein
MSESPGFKNPIFFFTRFAPKLTGGGCRRLVQLLEATPDIDWKLISSLDAAPAGSGKRRPENFLARRARRKNLQGWDVNHLSYVKSLWVRAEDWAATPLLLKGCGVALVDDPVYFAPIVHRLKKSGIKVVGVCHNIESLSRAQVSPGWQRRLLDRELDLLAECDMVLTISREETFLLQNLGMDAFYYPYFPPREAHDRLLGIRNRRDGTIKKDVLMVGTANNKATRQGMVAAIENWQKRDLGAPGRELLVAGFGTDSLAEYAGKGVRFLGPLSDQDLDTLLETVRACLCYQENASGALTRISEMLVAGVPVLANSLAARSYYNLEGVVEFADFDELEKALAITEGRDIEAPLPAAPDWQALQRTILRLAEKV